jgi:hypothetical protein
MQHPSFEAVKVAMKQDRTGYILTLSIHPDEVPEILMRDFVGARYAVVMVRINGQEQPMNREQEHTRDIVQLAGILCRDTDFHQFLVETGNAIEASEKETVDWMRSELGIASRAELKNNPDAAKHLLTINEEFKAWKRNA